MEQFREQLQRQLGFLERSCNSYDTGFRDEAIRMATCIRILVHDTRASTSLLSHLKAKNIRLLSTTRSVADPERVIGFDGLTSFGLKPKLGMTSSKVALAVNDWWEQIVYVVGRGQLIRRRNLVLTAANKDGGAHVDAALTPEYAKLMSIWNASGSEIVPAGPIQDNHLMGLRQLGFEILNSEELIVLSRQPDSSHTVDVTEVTK